MVSRIRNVLNVQVDRARLLPAHAFIMLTLLAPLFNRRATNGRVSDFEVCLRYRWNCEL